MMRNDENYIVAMFSFLILKVHPAQAEYETGFIIFTTIESAYVSRVGIM
jgi:hypothetical protein